MKNKAKFGIGWQVSRAPWASPFIWLPFPFCKSIWVRVCAPGNHVEWNNPQRIIITECNEASQWAVKYQCLSDSLGVHQFWASMMPDKWSYGRIPFSILFSCLKTFLSQVRQISACLWVPNDFAWSPIKQYIGKQHQTQWEMTEFLTWYQRFEIHLRCQQPWSLWQSLTLEQVAAHGLCLYH